MEDIFTIGHSTNTSDRFIELLRKHKINCVIDVRSTPFSRYSPQFNKNEIKSTLNKKGIHYIHMGDEFGARRKEADLYNSDGFVDFDKVRQSDLFNKGVNRIIDGIKMGYKISFMCTEKDPIDCHRCILVARQFHEIGYNVCNITQDGSIQNQAMIEQRLLDIYFKDRNEISLFAKEQIEEQKLIQDAYKLRNKHIGYHVEEDGD